MHYGARAIEPCQSWAGIAGPAVVSFELCPRNYDCSAETRVALQSWLHLYRAFLVCLGFACLFVCFSASFSWGMSMLTPCELFHEMCLLVSPMEAL